MSFKLGVTYADFHMFALNAEGRYTECSGSRYAECCGAHCMASMKKVAKTNTLAYLAQASVTKKYNFYKIGANFRCKKCRTKTMVDIHETS